jgi:hypothetical protein
MKCSTKKPNGSPCEARVRAGSEYCYFHDKQIAKERRIAQSKGGSKKKARPLLSGPIADFDLTTPEGMLASVQFALNRLVRDEIDAKTAHAIAYLSECARKLYDLAVLKRNIDQLNYLAKTERVYDPLREQLDDDLDQFAELATEENTSNA